MNQNVFEFIIIIVGMGCLTQIIQTIITRKRADKGDVAPALREISERLDRLERGVDTSAIEIERIAENQRFLTRVLTERERHLLGGDGESGRVRTPH